MLATLWDIFVIGKKCQYPLMNIAKDYQFPSGTLNKFFIAFPVPSDTCLNITRGLPITSKTFSRGLPHAEGNPYATSLKNLELLLLNPEETASFKTVRGNPIKFYPPILPSRRSQSHEIVPLRGNLGPWTRIGGNSHISCAGREKPKRNNAHMFLTSTQPVQR